MAQICNGVGGAFGAGLTLKQINASLTRREGVRSQIVPTHWGFASGIFNRGRGTRCSSNASLVKNQTVSLPDQTSPLARFGLAALRDRCSCPLRISMPLPMTTESEINCLRGPREKAARCASFTPEKRCSLTPPQSGTPANGTTETYRLERASTLKTKPFGISQWSRQILKARFPPCSGSLLLTNENTRAYLSELLAPANPTSGFCLL